MVQGVWLRAGIGLRVGCGTGGLVYGVGQEGSDEGRVGWGTGGLGYGWVGVRDGGGQGSGCVWVGLVGKTGNGVM